jgi:hypothetical protein
MLYHGCDDVADVRDLPALGGGGDEDLRDGILTLPAALAIRDPRISKLFCKSERSAAELQTLKAAFKAQLAKAEAHLDELAEKAKYEARQNSTVPDHLISLVDYTRELSRR